MRNRGKKSFPKRTAIFFLLGIFLFSFFSFAFGKKNFSSRWDGYGRFSLVLQNLVQKEAPLVVFSLEPQGDRAVYLSIPGKTLFEVPYGYQTYFLSSIYKLGTLDKKRKGGDLLKRSLELNLGVAIDAYLIQNHSSSWTFLNPEKIRKYKGDYFSFFGAIKNFFRLWREFSASESDLSWREKFRLWWAVRRLRSDQIVFLDLEKEGILREVVLPDGSLAKKVEDDLFALSSFHLFEDERIRKEGLSLEVVNASDYQGLAGKFTRLLERLGGNVVKKSTAEESKNETCLLFLSSSAQKSSFLVRKIQSLYHCQMAVQEKNSPEDVEIKIILGEAFIR